MMATPLRKNLPYIILVGDGEIKKVQKAWKYWKKWHSPSVEGTQMTQLPDRELLRMEGLRLVDPRGEGPRLLPPLVPVVAGETFRRSMSLVKPGTPAW